MSETDRALDEHPTVAPDGADQVSAMAQDVGWNLQPLLDGRSTDSLLDEADDLAESLAGVRGTLAEADSAELARIYRVLEQIHDLVGRAGNHAGLAFAVDTSDEALGAAQQAVSERSTAIGTSLLFIDLEWAALSDEAAETLLADPVLDFCAHHLRSARRYRKHLLTEPEETVLSERDQTGASAFARLFTELTSAIEVELAGDLPSEETSQTDGFRTVSLEEGLSQLAHPDREVRASAQQAVTEALEPGLRTRAFVFNTLLHDKAVEDRLRGHDNWLSSRNLSNEASDASVQSLVTAVKGRYDIPQRWYALKAQILGVDRLADYDRMASVAESEGDPVSWDEGRSIVLAAYNSFAPELGDIATRFFDEAWIDAPIRPGKRPGAFCAYTVANHHPYLFLNWTAQRRDVLTLAHEMGHGLHAYLSREQGIFHQSTPLTLAETASVFGETVTLDRLVDATPEPAARFALLAESLEGSIATVFRQTAMNQFEAGVHEARRNEGELSVERFGELWAQSQEEMLGDAVEVTENYRSWWSYIPHFIATPGYVYAYAYGQLLALSVYKRYEDRGQAFVPQYLELLRSGGSMTPEELGSIVDCDLADPSFWDGGLDIVEAQLDAATEAAKAAGRV